MIQGVLNDRNNIFLHTYYALLFLGSSNRSHGIFPQKTSNFPQIHSIPQNFWFGMSVNTVCFIQDVDGRVRKIVPNLNGFFFKFNPIYPIK